MLFYFKSSLILFFRILPFYHRLQSPTRLTVSAVVPLQCRAVLETAERRAPQLKVEAVAAAVLATIPPRRAHKRAAVVREVEAKLEAKAAVVAGEKVRVRRFSTHEEESLLIIRLLRRYESLRKHAQAGEEIRRTHP